MKMMKIMKKMSKLGKRTIGRRLVSLLLAVLSAGIYAQVPAASTSKETWRRLLELLLITKETGIGRGDFLLREGASKVITDPH